MDGIQNSRQRICYRVNDIGYFFKMLDLEYGSVIYLLYDLGKVMYVY